MKRSRSFSLVRRAVLLGIALVAALLLMAAPATAQHDDAARPAAQTVTAEAMAQAGLTRVDDLFWFLDGWKAASLDGYATRPSAAGLPGAPLLVAGGQPLTSGPFGLPPLALLAVHLQQVRSARALRAPSLAAGRLAPDGAVHLRLRRPAGRGVGVGGAFSAGNEVGDPGPFRSTVLGVQNVDRIGPQYFTEAHLGTRRTRAQLSLRAVRHYTTDAVIRPRVSFLRDAPGPPLQQLIAPRLMVETRRLGRHRLHAQYATLRALSFFQTLGYEIPTRRQQAQVGLEGQAPLLRGEAPALHYRLSYTHARASSDEERLRTDSLPSLAFGASENHVSGNASLGGVPLGFPSLHLRAGLSADYTRAGPSLRDPTLLTTRAYARLSAAPGAAAGVRPRLTLLLSQTDGQVGGGVTASASVQVAPRHHLDARVAYVRHPYAEGGPFWYWRAQGLRVPQAPASRVALPSSFSASDRFTADVRLQRSFEHGGHVAFELGARHFRHLTLPFADYGYDPAGGGLAPDLRLRPDAGGQTFHAGVEGERAFPSGLHHRLRYDFFAHHAAGSGRRAFEQRFERTPRHRVRYTARLAVGERFSLGGRFTVRSAEQWPAYRRAAQAAGSPYRSTLPAYALLDLTATKRLWEDHLRLRLALRNLLDAPRRTHPAGPARRLALFFSLEAQLW